MDQKEVREPLLEEMINTHGVTYDVVLVRRGFLFASNMPEKRGKKKGEINQFLSSGNILYCYKLTPRSFLPLRSLLR